MFSDVKELRKLLTLCREKGITEFSLGDCHIKFGPLPAKEQVQSDDIPTDEPSYEQLAFYSAEAQ
jgi:hypothetical protein